MKKSTSFLALFLAFVMCFCGNTLGVNAALPQQDGLNMLSNGSVAVGLEFSGNVALISYSVESNNSLSSLEIHVLLERRTGNSWTEVQSWSKTVEADSSDGSYTKVVSQTGYYCVTLWGYATLADTGTKEFFSGTDFAYYT